MCVYLREQRHQLVDVSHAEDRVLREGQRQQPQPPGRRRVGNHLDLEAVVLKDVQVLNDL